MSFQANMNITDAFFVEYDRKRSWPFVFQHNERNGNRGCQAQKLQKRTTKYHKSKHTVWLMHYIPGLLKFLWKIDWQISWFSMKSDNVQFVNNSSRLKNCDSSLWINCSFESGIFNEPVETIYVFIIHLCLCVLFKPEISSPQTLLLHESNDKIVWIMMIE